MIPEDFRLDGKVAIVTWASSYSKALALALAEAGADIGVCAPNERTIAVIKDEVSRLGRQTAGFVTNIASREEVQNMVERALVKFGRIDALVNCASVGFAKPFLEITEEEWRRLMEANLTSVFLCTQAVGQKMLQQKKGKVINVVSGLAARGVSNSSAFCASMGAVLQLTKALALEWARDGIRVNAIGMGWFSESDEGEGALEDPLVRFIPLRRRGRPADLEATAVYLASEASDFITGQIIFVDGGVVARA